MVINIPKKKISASLTVERPNFASELLHDIENITPDYYVENYLSFLSRYISSGHPSMDTLNSYDSSIKQFITWCDMAKLHPLASREDHMIYYRDWLYKKNYKDVSIRAKLSAIQRFFFVAIKLKFIKENPVEDIKVSLSGNQVTMGTNYFSAKQLGSLFDHVAAKRDALKILRDTAIIMLMGVEGLRTIEICRLSHEDINWPLKTILIKGKGHNDLIYPREDTIELLKIYIGKKPSDIPKKEIVTPLFVNLSRYKKYERITRDGVRRAINAILVSAGLKSPGKSCHTLRHTCGTLVYAATKDLQVVKEILRHRDPKITSIYAHVMNRQANRYTRTIPVGFKMPLEQD